MDIEPNALIRSLKASPFNTTFTRQMRAAQKLYGKQLKMPNFSAEEIHAFLQSLLTHYAERDRGLIADRVIECIL